MSSHASEEYSPPLSILGPCRRSHPCLSIPLAGPSCSCLAWLSGCSCAREDLGAAPHRGHSIAVLLSQQGLGAPSAELLCRSPELEDGSPWTGKVQQPKLAGAVMGGQQPTPPPQEAGG